MMTLPSLQTVSLRFSWVRGLALIGLSAGMAAGFSDAAQAVPSFSDQTGDPCSSCHVGSFGPQLTARGRQFKLSGYAEGSKARQVPLLAVMAETSFTKTAQNQAQAPASGFGSNDNGAIDQISLFLAGRIYDHLGVFSQTTWDGVRHAWAWDNTDLRYGREGTLGGIDTTFGITVNNNPTVTDIYNTTPAWGFPFAASRLAPTPGAAPLLQGALAQRVIGSTAYALFDDTIYAEVGGYRVLPGLRTQNRLGIKQDGGPNLENPAPYWRLAYQNETPKSSLSVGTFGLAAQILPTGAGAAGTDHYLDAGFDASYQWHASKAHVFSLYGSVIHESSRLNASQSLGNAADSRQSLTSFRATGSYYYDQSYGATLGLFHVGGSHDDSLYSTANGFANSSPASSGYVAQLDWTPFGKEDSWASPWANLRFALQYTGYTRFNGGTSNYDGTGRNASDNNTLYLLSWIAF